MLKLLDVLNRPELLDSLIGTLPCADIITLGMYIAVLRQRMSLVEMTTRHVATTETAPGTWSVVLDGAIVAGDTPCPAVFVTDPANRHPALRADRRTAMLADALRERAPVPPWPISDHWMDLSPAANAVLNRWMRQWAKHRSATVRRCAQPTCGIAGGRLFIARTSDRDCRYCRRGRGGSKTTRWRRRISERSVS